MKFDLALDPSRDVLRDDRGGESSRLVAPVHSHEAVPRRPRWPPGARAKSKFQAGLDRPSPPASTANVRFDEAIAGPPVLHAVVAPDALEQLLKREAADVKKGQQDIKFTATLSDHDTLVVPSGAMVVGNLEAPSVHVQGTVYGTVKATLGCLIVDRDARVHGRVDGAGTVVVAGLVRATGTGAAVVAHGNLRLARSACVWGAVHYTAIEIYEGAVVAGAMVALAHA